MKTSKKILTLTLTSVLALSLAACKEETRNIQTPFGNINPSLNVVEAGDFKISEKELYNRLRYNNGYNAFKNKLDTIVYADEIANFDANLADNKMELNKKLATEVYGSFNPKELSIKLKEEEKTNALHISRLKYIDKMNNLGIKVTESQLELNEIDLNAEYVTFKNIPEQLVKYYSKDLIKRDANKAYLESIIDKENLEKEEGKIEKNPNYFNPEKDLEANYNNGYKKYNTSRGVILRFNNYSEAMNAINDVTSAPINDGNARTVYTDLFNNYYNYEEATTDINAAKRTKFVTNKDKNELSAISAQVETVFLEELTNEGVQKNNKKWYLDAPVNLDGKYYLMYKIDTVYDIYNVENGNSSLDKSEALDFDKLKDPKNKVYYDKALAEAKKTFINSKISSVETDLYNEELEKLKIRIYDPFIENEFSNNYTDYEYVKEFNNDFIFKTKNDINYSVADFYNDIKATNLNSTLTNLVINKKLYNEEKDYLAKDAEADLRSTIKDELNTFKEGKSSLNKAYGTENYLFYSYGYSTVEEIVTNKLGEQIKTKLLSDVIFNSFINADDHTFSTDPKNLEFFKQIRNTAMAIYNETAADKKLYSFNMNIDHILISIDNNADGNPDDLKQFLDSLNETETKEFEKAVSLLANEIYNEVSHIKGHPTFEKLQYIVEAFNNNYETYSGKHWNDFKTYKFVLKAESLGDVDQNSVNNYVPEFKDYVIDMFNKAVKDDLKIEEKDEKLGQIYFPYDKTDVNNLKADDLCATMFGYHIISLNSYSDKRSELSFSLTNNDSNKNYGEITVMIDEKSSDTKDDDIYAVIDLFNYTLDGKDSNERFGETFNEKTPSLNQVFVYYVEYVNGSVHSIKTSLKNDLSKLLDATIDKFKSTAFQEYLLVKSIFATNFKVDNSIANEYVANAYLEELERKSEDYKLDSPYSSWYEMSWPR